MKATTKMIDFADAIAETLDLPPLDTTDFDEVAEFIDEYKSEFYYQQRHND